MCGCQTSVWPDQTRQGRLPRLMHRKIIIHHIWKIKDNLEKELKYPAGQRKIRRQSDMIWENAASTPHSPRYGCGTSKYRRLRPRFRCRRLPPEHPMHPQPDNVPSPFSPYDSRYRKRRTMHIQKAAKASPEAEYAASSFLFCIHAARDGTACIHNESVSLLSFTHLQNS